MMGKDIAESLKENGNAFYQASFFAKAENVYYKALNEMEDPKLPVVLRVTIYSNRANARSEMGNYSGAADDSSNTIGVVHSEGKALDEALLSKNEWRLARCLFYDQRDDELKALVAAKEAETYGTLGKGAVPAVSEMFNHVYKEMPAHLRKQRQEAGV